MPHPVDKIRNVVFCGHGSAGKTSLVDRILIENGVVTGNHSVDDQTSICDFDPEERKHKYTIEATAVHLEKDEIRYHLIDTPGYPDFIGQVIGPMQAVETAIIVINAHSGIEVNTRRVFKEAGNAGVGRMIVINKIDDQQADLKSLVDSIQQVWGPQCMLLNVPIGKGDAVSAVASVLDLSPDTSGAVIDPQELHEPLIEAIVQVDDQTMERYFEGQEPSRKELHSLIVTAVREGFLIPIVCCSAKTGVGISELLDAIKLCGLSPADFSRSCQNGSGEIEIVADSSGPLIAQVFRTRIDPFVQKLNFIRIYSGTLRRDDSVHASSARKNIKFGPLLEVLGESTHPIDQAGPGEIVAVAKMEDLHTGTVLGDFEIRPLQFPNPMVSLAVQPKTRGDETKLSGALHKVLEEDPTFRLDRDGQTHELVMTGMSELHLTIIQERLARRDKLEVETKEPRIAFRETIMEPAEGSYRHRKQSGGRGQFGEIHIRMRPLPRGTNVEEFATKANFSSMKEPHYDEKSNFLWIDSIVGGTIPGNFMPAIGKGFAERIAGGVIAGYPVQDVCVEVHFGKHHPVDSSEAAFKTAARMAFKQVFEQAKPCLLEPIVHMDITVPDEQVGDVYSDMSSRHGRVLGSDPAGGLFTSIHCEVPLREVTTYARTLSSMTGGMGSFTMEFSHYAQMPANVQHDIIGKADLKDEEEE